MKRIILFIFLILFGFSLAGCNQTQESKKEQIGVTNSGNYSDSENSAMAYFATLNEAVNKDTSGTFADIKYGTDAYAAIVAIEKLYKSNSSSEIITQMYYYAEVISCIETSNVSGSKYYDQAITYANQINLSYNGPYATEIKALAEKYSDSKGIQSKKSALTMSASEKSEVKAYINDRYEYYDKMNGGYAGDKYTETIWKETADKFGISTTDVDMIWAEH